MTRRADEIGLDDFSQRITVSGVNDELGHLAPASDWSPTPPTSSAPR
jgi:hypothetical protein